MDLITPENTEFLSALDDARRDEILHEAARAEMMSTIAMHRWTIASKAHRLQNGKPLDFDKYPYQKAIYQDTATELVIMGSVQWGKALSKSCLVLTAFGWKLMGDMVVGDMVVTPDNKTSRVIGVFPQGVIQLYTLRFSGGRSVVACAEHLWSASINGVPKKVTTSAMGTALNKGGFVSVPVYIPDLKETQWARLLSIDPAGRGDAQCIKIDDPKGLFITDDYIVTHNSEFLICSSAAMSAIGLSVFFVISQDTKRDKFVASRITPAFREIPLYRKMLEQARARSADTDSARLKAFGLGSINFVGSNSPKNFTSYPADVAIVDEHQECVIDNLAAIDSRMSGSPYQFRIIVGNPKNLGTEENQNLDWEYQNTNRNQWHVPCDYCGTMQVLGWWSHVVKEEKNKNGAIISVSPRDQEYTEGDRLDMRPICTECSRPINRLHRGGIWIPENAEHHRHGFQLSNLYNCNMRLDKLYALYRAGLISPLLMARFINDQLGLPYTAEGSSITPAMLESASSGDACGIQPYRVVPSSMIQWVSLN